MTTERRRYRLMPRWWSTLSTQALLAEYAGRVTDRALIYRQLADQPARPLLDDYAIDGETARLRVIARLLTDDLHQLHGELRDRHGHGIAGMILDHYDAETHKTVPGQPIDAASTTRPSTADAALPR